MTTGTESNPGALIGVVLSGILAARLWAASSFGRRTEAVKSSEALDRKTNSVDGYVRQ